MKKILILDIKQKVNECDIVDTINKYSRYAIEYIALTPYSIYFYEKLDIKYKTFHSFLSVFKFTEKINNDILELSNNLPKFYDSLMIDLIKLISFEKYTEVIVKFLNNYNQEDIVYVSDTDNSIFDGTNQTSFINDSNITRIHIKNNYKKVMKPSLKTITIGKIKNKLIQYMFKLKLNYDWKFFIFDIIKFNYKTYSHELHDQNCLQKNELLNILNLYFKSNFTNKKVKVLVNSLYSVKNNMESINKPIFTTWESNIQNLIISYKNFSLFYQHGNYFYINMILEYSEINPADINFVFNDYTKKLFEDLGAKEIYSVGSIIYNKRIKEKNKNYDFLYIIQGHDYTGNLQYVDFQNSLHSFDGYELYQRHKNIIKLFGEKFREKKIIIRVHPVVVTTGVYVPFWELSKLYPNITIDVSIPIHTLIETSKYIISDYFTTEFINRELHYKRDIILFQGAPTPLPKETVDDMKKMFILVDTVNDLEKKVSNIDKITKNRKRYDDIIEYYSSKKCDTKKVVKQILEKELNARK